MSQRVRVQNFAITQDGFGSGEGQSLEHPFGHLDPFKLMNWAFETRTHPFHTNEDGSQGLDDYFMRDYDRNIGAEIMGRNKFGPLRGPWENEEWQGWWGETPPFHTPVFVLTHFARPSLTLSDTTFHFIDESPEEALRIAKEASGGKDVRIGGGVATVRAFLDADLIDEMHIAVAPFTAGKGERLWESYDYLLDRFKLESIPSPSGVTHLLFWRK
ncbi:dihydrofolate reductase family protein [soil metagenome]